MINNSPPEEQPMPIPNGRPSIQGLVRADLEARERVGIQRYGTPLQAHNGRDALRDAYEEALDLACYLRQAIEERGAPTFAAWWREQRPDLWQEPTQPMADTTGGTTPVSEPCCDLHGRNCEQGGEECCWRCTEAHHFEPGHGGVPCSAPDLGSAL